jgi:predicted nucleotidyltransferase
MRKMKTELDIAETTAELRRLHEMNAELVETLQQIIDLPEDSRIHYKVARKAIAKTTREQK